ncbi:hypothetical protein [Legionella brunensis]|uniref:Uncharacterized protein n=1 Tax=Legionella brunensis TaxID=29422 RepID=A0A0W0SE47_9GAMM|nr:hypothetical protein [Legionella brunensis]KTC81650.1 hypothetical protein Lbru_2170 [Legionella brunensis]
MKISNPNVQLDSSSLEFFFRAYIRRYVSAVPPKYSYVNESGVNPAFQSIEEITYPLLTNEKRLFVLRRDLILATGIKNAYQEYGYQGLKKAFASKNHDFINWEDRYGHTSLATPDNQYDGQVLYAGFICQRDSYLEIFLSSGRFNRHSRTSEGVEPLSTEQRTIVESYLTLKFTQTYGQQSVIFYDTLPGKQDDEDSALFFADKPFPDTKICRIYDEKSISEAKKFALVALNYIGAQQYICKYIAPIKPKYKYDNEGCINPAFENIEQIKFPLKPLEKRIWVLRTDFILATGVKNAYQEEYGYFGLKDTFNETLHTFLNPRDRYGHPSLTIPEQEYDGSVFYAGYLCQRQGFLQAYLVSGRFDRKDLSDEQTQVLEAYIASLLQTAYGQQPIVFDYGDPDNTNYHKIFFGNGIFAKTNPQRIYTLSRVNEVMDNIPQLLGQKRGSQTDHQDYHSELPEVVVYS